MQPARIARFEILDCIGHGSAGIVYRGRDDASGELVAVKLLSSDVFSDPLIERRFIREVSILQRLNHPNIVRHIDCGLHDDRIYVALEFVESGTLETAIRQGNIDTWRMAAGYARQICAALHHAHRFDVIHRDLKPANVLLSSDSSVKLCDFGIARDIRGPRLTAEGTTVGTVRYMAPEQIRAVDTLTGRTDLYSLGCVLHEMITGHPPFDDPVSIAEVLQQHLHAKPPHLRDSRPEIPPDLDRLVDLLLKKDAHRRPASAQAVESHLTDILAGRAAALF